MKASDIAAKAADLVGGDRARTHGDKMDNHRRIATLWNAWLLIRRNPGSELTAFDVAQMMSLLKKARTQSGSYNPDDFVDDAGYASVAGEIADRIETDNGLVWEVLDGASLGPAPASPFWEMVVKQETMAEAAAASDADPLAR